jgi:AraC-like DNA-binding protein
MAAKVDFIRPLQHGRQPSDKHAGLHLDEITYIRDEAWKTEREPQARTLRLRVRMSALLCPHMPPPPLLPPALWQGIGCEWLWVYHGIAPRVRIWSQEITVPSGVFFVESGAVKIRAEGREILVPPKHVFFSAPGLRQQWFEPETRLLSVGLRCQWPDGVPMFKAGLNIALPTSRTPKLLESTRTLRAIVHGRKKQVSYQEATAAQNRSLAGWAEHEAGYQGWFAEYVRTLERLGIAPTARAGTGDRRLEFLRQCLHTWPLDQALDLTTMATEIDLSPRRIHDLLRQDLGMTAQVYLEKRRLEQARLRLIHEDSALKEIAFALGFRHPPHFTAWFRRHTGMTPTAYRQSHGMEGA